VCVCVCISGQRGAEEMSDVIGGRAGHAAARAPAAAGRPARQERGGAGGRRGGPHEGSSTADAPLGTRRTKNTKNTPGKTAQCACGTTLV